MFYGDRIYLSIDIDYWADFNRFARRKSMTRIIKRIRDLHVPIYYREEHQQLLPHMNWFKYDTLINMDTHADVCEGIAGKTLKDFNEGTWVNYISPHIRERGTYVWVYPDKASMSFDVGFCHTNSGPDPFSDKSLEICGWKHTHYCSLRLPSHVWNRIIAVGICRSRDWCTKFVIKDFDDIAKKFGLELQCSTSPDKFEQAFPKTH